MPRSSRQTEQDAAVEQTQDTELGYQDDSQVEENYVSEESEGDGGMEAAEAIDSEQEVVGQEDEDNTPSWKRPLVEAGFDDFEDVDSAITNTVSAIKQRDEQIKQLAQQVKFYQDSQRYSGGQAPQAPVNGPGSQPQQQEEERDLLSTVLEGWEDPRWAEQYIEVDEETGMRRLKDGLDDITKEKVIATDRKLRQWAEILQDPRQFAAAVDKRVERMIRDNFEKGFEQRQTQQQEQQAVNSFVNENATWLYQRDPATGQYIKDPLTNEFVLSGQGAEFLGQMEAAKNDGISSVSKQIHYAKLAMGLAQRPAQQSAGQQQKPVNPADVVAQRRREMQGRRNVRPGTQREFNGVSPDSATEPTGKTSLSFGEETLALMKAGSE